MGSEECMSGKAIYQNFMDGRGTEPLMDSQRSIGTVSDFYEERVSQIKRLAASMEEGWTGNASGSAQRGAGPLAEAHARASVEMKTAKDLLSRQSESYGVAHANVVDVPDMPKEPSLFKKVVTLGGAQDSYEDKVEASNAANQRNISVMRDWADASSVNGAMMPTDYGDIGTNDVTVGVKEKEIVVKREKWPPDPVVPPKHVEREGGDDDKKVGSGDDDKKVGTDDDKLGPDDKTVRPPTEDRPIRIDEQLPPSFDDDWHHTFPDQTDKPDTVKPPTSGGKDELTRPEDFTPEKPGDRPGWNLPGGPGGTGGTGGTSGTGQGSSSGTGFGPFCGLGGSGSGVGSGSGSGSGSGRFGSGGGGTGSASGLGGEKSLGGRGVGSASGAAEAMGRGGVAGGKGMGGGAAGRPGGAGGMPGMGAGQRGQGDEDEEHQRKYIVDDDEAFQLTDDGERLTDPRTGMPLTPPVIGE